VAILTTATQCGFALYEYILIDLVVILLKDKENKYLFKAEI